MSSGSLAISQFTKSACFDVSQSSDLSIVHCGSLTKDIYSIADAIPSTRYRLVSSLKELPSKRVV